VLLLDSVTTTPPAGAGPVRVAVPVAEVPPRTEFGDFVIADNVAAFTVSVVFFDTP
jgi:hypothetical protein